MKKSSTFQAGPLKRQSSLKSESKPRLTFQRSSSQVYDSESNWNYAKPSDLIEKISIEPTGHKEKSFYHQAKQPLSLDQKEIKSFLTRCADESSSQTSIPIAPLNTLSRYPEEKTHLLCKLSRGPYRLVSRIGCVLSGRMLSAYTSSCDKEFLYKVYS